jgi:hypothetical protein
VWASRTGLGAAIAVLADLAVAAGVAALAAIVEVVQQVDAAIAAAVKSGWTLAFTALALGAAAALHLLAAFAFAFFAGVDALGGRVIAPEHR